MARRPRPLVTRKHVSHSDGNLLLQCRDMRPGEESAVLALVMRGFDQFVRQGFSEAGAAEFSRAARRFVLEQPDGHAITVAESGGDLVGMIDLRDDSHVSLFFVEAAHQRCGIGAALLAAAIEKRVRDGDITVNSAPAAVPAYRALGFVQTAEEAELDGIRYVAMLMELPARG